MARGPCWKASISAPLHWRSVPSKGLVFLLFTRRRRRKLLQVEEPTNCKIRVGVVVSLLSRLVLLLLLLVLVSLLRRWSFALHSQSCLLWERMQHLLDHLL
mmetsp:Transcript_2606/g.6340  ORF Transcript_2606/g.6340 Transcript_2606/m.6340 type:complete len:101 (-) Transcript_2606:167-469(-)